MNILVIGDSCRDIFVYGSIDRVSPEAPVPIIVPAYQKENAGMAGNVAANLKSLGANVTLITNKQEIKKIRFVDERYNHMVLRVDEGDRCERISKLELNYSDYDAVIISDYCKGFLTEKDIQYISENCSCPTFLDTKKSLGDWCNKIDYIKINNFEYEKNKDKISNSKFLKDKIITTQGKRGCVYMQEVFPTQEVSVKDVSGAGDTFISGLVFEYIKTRDIRKSIHFAQQCTTKVVQKTGVATV